MTLRYLLDANVLSEMARPMPDRLVIDAIQRHERLCAMAAVTLEELTYGVARLPRGARRTGLERWIQGLAHALPVLPYDSEAATWLGRESARLDARGISAPRTDGEIAAVAVTRKLTLVTRNFRDFVRFAGLKVENWHDGRPSDR